jgi:hypothetical protein
VLTGIVYPVLSLSESPHERGRKSQGQMDEFIVSAHLDEFNVCPRSVEVIFGSERDTLLTTVNVVTEHPRGRRFYPLASLFAGTAVTFDELRNVHN